MATTNPTGGTKEQSNQAGAQQGKGAAKAQAEQQAQGERGTGPGTAAGRPGGRLARRGLTATGLGALAPFRMSPFSALRRMMEDFDRMFDEFGFGVPGLQRWEAGGLWMPQVEEFERDGNLVVRADLPGLRKEDVRVLVTDDALVIEGERRREVEEERRGMYRTELAYGAFRRAIPLPEGASAENTEARFENGVLEVRIPLPKEGARARRIEIKGGAEAPAVH